MLGTDRRYQEPKVVKHNGPLIPSCSVDTSGMLIRTNRFSVGKARRILSEKKQWPNTFETASGIGIVWSLRIVLAMQRPLVMQVSLSMAIGRIRVLANMADSAPSVELEI